MTFTLIIYIGEVVTPHRQISNYFFVFPKQPLTVYFSIFFLTNCYNITLLVLRIFFHRLTFQVSQGEFMQGGTLSG